jgi:hypothetical protein
MHTLLIHKMLQFLYYTAPTCFGPHGPSSGSTYHPVTRHTAPAQHSTVTRHTAPTQHSTVTRHTAPAHTPQTEISQLLQNNNFNVVF